MSPSENTSDFLAVDGYEEPYNILRNSMISSAMVNGESEQTPLWLECFACMNEYQLTV